MPETVGIRSGERLLDHDRRLVQIIRRRDRLRNLFAVLRLGGEGSRLEDGAHQRGTAVGHLRHEFPARGEAATGMPIPDLLGQDVEKADPVVDGTLANAVGRQKAVDVVRAQIRHHLGRRNDAQLHVRLGIESVLGQVVAQKIVMHGVVEGNREFEALPLPGIAFVLVLDRKRDALTVDVLNCRDARRLPVRR